MKLNVKIRNIKSIDNLEIDLPIENGLYAITGQNGSGKSTLVTCASSVFFNMKMNAYFGKTNQDASIDFQLNGSTRSWKKTNNGGWERRSEGTMDIKGFYEGSIIFGNRFRNTSYRLLKELDKIQDDQLTIADEFIRTNLGKILHNDINYYEKLFKVSSKDRDREFEFRGDIFFYEKNGRRVSQFHMSTGENLLVNVLNSLHLRNNDRASLTKPCLMFLDEIELALHPSSLKRLVEFLREMSNEYNYAIYFSTHSIELIGSIKPENIFFLQRHADNSAEIINPCYPAYATRILYDHSGYDHVFLVEDDLAKEIINKILRKNKLLDSKLIHILPCGGYTNVIDLAKDVVNSNLLGKVASVSIILDGDVKSEAEKYIQKNHIKNNIPLSYLPIESLEKYLKQKLFHKVDQKLFRTLNDYIFHQVSLSDIIKKYRREIDPSKDNNGKKLFERIINEIELRKKSRNDLIEIIVDHVTTHENESSQKILNYLISQLRNSS